VQSTHQSSQQLAAQFGTSEQESQRQERVMQMMRGARCVVDRFFSTPESTRPPAAAPPVYSSLRFYKFSVSPASVGNGAAREEEAAPIGHAGPRGPHMFITMPPAALAEVPAYAFANRLPVAGRDALDALSRSRHLWIPADPSKRESVDVFYMTYLKLNPATFAAAIGLRSVLFAGLDALAGTGDRAMIAAALVRDMGEVRSGIIPRLAPASMDAPTWARLMEEVIGHMVTVSERSPLDCWKSLIADWPGFRA
jgi:hypothetical protein